MSLRDWLIAACGQPLNSVLILFILGPSLGLTVRVCSPSSPLPERTKFSRLMSFRSWVLPLSGFWWILFITRWCCTVSLLAFYTPTGTIGFPWWSWLGLFGSGNGNWLISSCATRFSTVALCFAAFVFLWYSERVRACPVWFLRICLTSRELSAKDDDGGPLGTLAVIASSVQGVLVRLGDGGALGALSDSVEQSLLGELPLVSLEAVSDVVSPVSMVDEEPGLLSDVPLVSAALLSANEPVSGTLSWSSSRCSAGSGLGIALAGGVITLMGSATGGGLGSGGLLHSLMECILSRKQVVIEGHGSLFWSIWTKSTAVSLSKLCGGPDRTKLPALFASFSPSSWKYWVFTWNCILL